MIAYKILQTGRFTHILFMLHKICVPKFYLDKIIAVFRARRVNVEEIVFNVWFNCSRNKSVYIEKR